MINIKKTIAVSSIHRPHPLPNSNPPQIKSTRHTHTQLKPHAPGAKPGFFAIASPPSIGSGDTRAEFLIKVGCVRVLVGMLVWV